ncbi:hypothetical protein ACFOHK_20990 [Falsigemmobacter intermedius]
MTARKAREVARQNSFLGDGLTYIEPINGDEIDLPHVPPGSNGLDHPSVASQVERWERTSLLEMKARGEVLGNFKAGKDDAERGGPVDYDHILIAFTPDQSAMLKEDENLRDQVRRAVIRALATSPQDPDARRQLIATPMHMDRAEYHLQVILSRTPLKRLEDGQVLVQNAIVQDKSSPLNSVVGLINDALEAEGLTAFQIGAREHPRTAEKSALDTVSVMAEPLDKKSIVLPPAEGSLASRVMKMTPDEDKLRRLHDRQAKEVADLEAALEAARQRKDDIANAFAATVQIREAQEEAAAAKTARDEAEQLAFNALEKAERADKARAEATAKAEAAEAAQARAENQLAEVQQQLATLAAKLHEANGKLGDVQDKLKLSVDRETELEGELEASVAATEAAQADAKAIADKLAAEQVAHAAALAAVQAELAEVKKARQVAETKLAGEQAAREAEKITFGDMLKSLSTDKAASDAAAAAAKAETEAARKTQAEAARKLADALAEFSRVSEELDRVKEELGTEKDKHSELRTVYDKLVEKYRALRTFLKGSIQQLMGWRAENIEGIELHNEVIGFNEFADAQFEKLTPKKQEEFLTAVSDNNADRAKSQSPAEQKKPEATTPTANEDTPRRKTPPKGEPPAEEPPTGFKPR